jgi:hypothetical protein
MANDAGSSRLKRSYFTASLEEFLEATKDQVLGQLTAASEFDVGLAQRDAWQYEIGLLQQVLPPFRERGRIFLEFVVPRLGKRIDAVLLVDDILFVVEFKVGEKAFGRQDIEQVWDYALDLKNFHETSHGKRIVPVLLISDARQQSQVATSSESADGVMRPILAPADDLTEVLRDVLGAQVPAAASDDWWESGRYRPTPTIIEAATVLYRQHSVADINRHDAGQGNLGHTSAAVSRVIERSRKEGLKSICLVTGVPGAGKTLVGLDIATKYMDRASELHSVYLSGNGPLVSILREALVRDDVRRAKAAGQRRTKSDAAQAVKAFIQPVHHFRDEYLKDPEAPGEHVAIFDEAQRAWNLEKTADFMARKKSRPGFSQSEPEFLISCLDRHRDWAVVVCLIGGGQEINTGEAGISEWIRAIQASYPDWQVHLSPHLRDADYASADALESLETRPHVTFDEALHLAVSLRSFRSEHVSNFVKKVLDYEQAEAARIYAEFAPRYPIVLTRDLSKAKRWLRTQARGSERYGIVVSSQAQRLKPHAIDVRTPMDPVNWFLNDRDDVRSSFYLEDVATEFHVQGLELDWCCVVWDADFRHGSSGWRHHSFVGNRWQNIRKAERQNYLKNAYRVLLTRARQGMVIVVPQGDDEDATREAEFFDGTFEYLRGTGLPLL